MRRAAPAAPPTTMPARMTTVAIIARNAAGFARTNAAQGRCLSRRSRRLLLVGRLIRSDLRRGGANWSGCDVQLNRRTVDLRSQFLTVQMAELNEMAGTRRRPRCGRTQRPGELADMLQTQDVLLRRITKRSRERGQRYQVRRRGMELGNPCLPRAASA